MNRIHLPRLFYVGMLFMLASCQAAGQPLNTEMRRPGDTIGSMSLTTGSVDAPPLRAFCSPAGQRGNTVISHCNVPLLPRLAVGQVFLDEDFAGLDWSALSWELYIDDQAVDLERFGTYDIALPAMPGSPSPIREVFTRSTAWDVVLTNLTPGEHTLSARVQAETVTYSWFVNLTVEANDTGAETHWTGIQKIS